VRSAEAVLRSIQASQDAWKGSDGEVEVVYEEYREDVRAAVPRARATAPSWSALRTGTRVTRGEMQGVPPWRPSRASWALLLAGSSVLVAAGLLLMHWSSYQETAARASCGTPGASCEGAAGADSVADPEERQALVRPVENATAPPVPAEVHGHKAAQQRAGGTTTAPPAGEGGRSTNNTTSTSAATPVKWSPKEPTHPLPAGLTGVNLGSWLCLEDWFFSGEDGRYVDSGWQTGQGNCLVPEKPELDFQWKSEGELTRRLGKEAAKVIGAHRRTFITEADFAQAAKLGIKTVRIPITWAAFADALSEISPKHYGRHDPDTEEVPIPDPFYHKDIYMLTIPRDFLRSILDWAANHELKVVWDIHAHPGGSANGTFNGIWPRVPAFWHESSKLGDKSVPLTEAGLLVTRALIKWVEGLGSRHQKAIAGLTLMNEPAHLSWGEDWSSNDAVLDWLTKAADVFRNSSLPKRGLRLYVNLVETAFGNWGADFGSVVPTWWYNTFSDDERRDWAVIDRHKYYSWDKQCSGCDGDMCGWRCDTPADASRSRLRGCIETWQNNFNQMFKGGLRAASEFSTSTYRDAAIACRDMDLARSLLEDQVAAFKANGVEGFFWTWRIPYGPKFQSGWSLKYLTGVEDEDLPHQCAAAQRRELQLAHGAEAEPEPVAREGGGEQPAEGALGSPGLPTMPGRGDPEVEGVAMG